MMQVKMQHSVQRGCQGYCLSLSGGFSASRLVRWLLGFSASRLPGGSSASRLLGLPGGSSASRLLGFFSAFGLCRTSRLLSFSASRLLGLCRASRLLGFWSHFCAPFARALEFASTPTTTDPLDNLEKMATGIFDSSLFPGLAKYPRHESY